MRAAERAEFERWRRQRLPKISAAERLAMVAIELCRGRPLSAVKFRLATEGEEWRALWRRRGMAKRLLRRLIDAGLIEVVSLGPAVYRVTRLGRLTRRLRG